MSRSFVLSTVASASADGSSFYRAAQSQSATTPVLLLCCVGHRFLLTDGVCSLCSGQKLQNVNVPDKWLNVESVVCLDVCPSGLVLAPQRHITEVASDQQESQLPRSRHQNTPFISVCTVCSC